MNGAHCATLGGFELGLLGVTQRKIDGFVWAPGPGNHG